MGKKQTPRKIIFAHEYTVDRNGTQAAIRAGYAANSAKITASRLLKDPEVAAVIEKATEKAIEKIEITADSVLQEIAKLGFGNMQNLFDEEGNAIAIQDLPPEVAVTITEITETVLKTNNGDSDGSGEESQVLSRKYKLADKKGNLELLGRHLKLFVDRIEADVSVSQAERVKALKAKRIAE